MPNPWVELSLDDYEGHMRASGVEQLGALSELFAETLAKCRPRSVAIFGIAGGNGLEAVDPVVTTRVVGLDINPAYLEATRHRFPAIPNLELHCIDLANETIELDPVKAPLEDPWLPYLAGRGTRDEAFAALLARISSRS